MITATDLELRAGSRILLSGATLRVQQGDRIGLVGRNGAGKTTTMRVLAGESDPYSGSVGANTPVGYLPQDPREGDLLVPASGQHPVLRRESQVALARVLRQVADRPVRRHRARVGLPRTGEHAHRGGLAGTVAPDKADAVARLHAQGGAGQQDAGPGTKFQVGRGDHRAPGT